MAELDLICTEGHRVWQVNVENIDAVLLIISIGFLIYQQREMKSSLSKIQEQTELIEILESEKEKLISEEQELQDKLDSLKNGKETLESEITANTEENKSLSKSIDQSKQNVTRKEEEKAETTKEVTESNNVSQDFLDKISNLGEGFGGAGGGTNGQAIADAGGKAVGITLY